MYRGFMIHRFLMLLLLCSFFGGCTQVPDEGGARRLSLHLTSEPVTLDPSRVEDGLGFRLISNLMEGLMGFNSRGELVKRLAESVEVSADLKTYRFKLRPGAHWSDGVPVEVFQFQTAIQRALLPETGSKLSGLLKWIEGAQAFSEGKATRVSGIETKENEITFHLVKPISFFDQVLALPMTYPLRKDVLDANGGKWDPLRGKNIPTNGPYRIRSSTPDQEIFLEAARPLHERAPKEVQLRVVSDESTSSTLFERGSLDVLTRIPVLDQKRLERRGLVKTVPFQATYFLGFNLKKKPFDRVEYRRALSLAIHRLALVRVMGTGELPARSWIPKGAEGYYEYESGGSVPKNSTKWNEEVRIAFDSGTRNSLVMEKIQSDIKASLGWDVRLKSMDWKPHVSAIYTDPEMVFRFGWSSPMQDPALFLSAFATGDPFSFSHYSNSTYDRLVEEIFAMKPSKEREAKMILAQKILVEKDVVVVPLYHYVSTYAVGPRVSKYDVNPFGITLFEEVEMKP